MSEEEKISASENSNEKVDETVNQENVESEIKKLQGENQLLKDTVLRKMAESDNLRKRLEKEKDDAVKYSNSKFAKDLLAVIDNFERISANSSSVREKIENDANLKALFDGIMLCEKELLGTLKKYGISQIEAKKGDPFNPTYHQAMCELESEDCDAGTIVQVMQTGYVYHDRLLRPTMVSVAKKA